MHDNSVPSSLAKYKLVLYFLTMYGCIVRATNTTTVNGTTVDEIQMYIVGDKAELKCPVTVKLVDDRMTVQWLTPRYSLIAKSTVDNETGIFRGDGRLVLTGNGSLRISPACCLDVGTYTCFVERMNPNDGTRLIIGEASVSLLMNTTSGFECDTKEQTASCNMTISGITEDNRVINNVALYIGTFIGGVIWGVIVVYLTQCLRKRCRNRRHRRIVAKLRKGSVSLSERAGSAKGKSSLQAVAADNKEPQQFDMVTNPLQDEQGLQQGYAFDQAPSPPPRVEHHDNLANSSSPGMSRGRLTVAIHASSLQELNTVGSVSPDTSGSPQTRNLQKSTQNGLGHNPTYGLYEREGICTTNGETATTILAALDAELSLDDALAFKSSDYSKTQGDGEEGDGYLHLSDCSDDYQGLDGIIEESRDGPRPKGTIPLQHNYTSVKCRPANTQSLKHRTSSSDDYEHLNLFSPKQLSLKGPGAQYGVGRFNTSYLRPMANYERCKIGRGGDGDLPPPPPPPATIVEESSRSQSGSHTSLPLPPPPVDASGEGPFYVFVDNKGYTALQTTSTWPRRVSAKKRYQPIAVTKDTPDYLEIIASADCIYNSAKDEFYF